MNKIKNLRKEKGLSLKELGDLLGVAESTVSLYERHQREAPYNILLKLSEIFGVSINFLLGEEHKNFGNLSLPLLNSVNITGEKISHNYSDENYIFNFNNSDNLFLFRMHDDTMEPQISIGDIAIVEKTTDIRDGEIGAVIYGDSPITLRVVSKKDNITILESFNKKYRSVFLGENDKFIVLGKVLSTIKKW